jgi:outer membrane protein TolC
VREVEEALINLQSTDERASDAETAVTNYQVSFDATQQRYGTGLASLFDLEDARRTLFVSETARVSLQRERAEAWVSLYRAMGGGWSRPESVAITTTPVTPSP